MQIQRDKQTHTSLSQQIPPVQLLLLERIAEIRAEVAKCCPPSARFDYLSVGWDLGGAAVSFAHTKQDTLPEGTQRTSPAALFPEW